MSNPLLSIGMIFRNDIRSLDKCLRALQPLRDAVPCELIMADTGSTDGCRLVAERYADEVFDFPWVDDFSAARNAVMDRAGGKWYLTVDSDEYLDGDISELLAFLREGDKPAAMLVQRNYLTREMDGTYSDSWVGRLVRMSSGLRYRGRIHEDFPVTAEQCAILSRTVLHHDGYVELNDGTGGAKRKRNVDLLRASLTETPEDLRLYMQLAESGREEPDWLEVNRRGASLVEQRKPGWREYGPPIFRQAVFAARQLHLPEFREWVERAESWFPESYFTRIDVAHTAFIDSWEREEWTDCIRRGERFLDAAADYRAGGNRSRELLFSTLVMAAPKWERNVRILLVNAYARAGQLENAQTVLGSLDGAELDVTQAGNLALAMLELQSGSDLELRPLFLRLYEEICRSEEWKRKFLAMLAAAFDPDYRERELARPGFRRPSHTLLLPLTGEHALGTAAAILESGDRAEMERLLGTVRDWEAFPGIALERALLAGVPFPLEDRPLTLEVMDGLAAHLAERQGHFPEVLEGAIRGMGRDFQALAWARGLALAALRTVKWADGGGNVETVRAFAAVERAFLPQYYAAAVRCNENVCLLPPLHRFGWYCAQAFEALDAGNTAKYVQLLRAGLRSCESAKPVAEFLLENTPELQAVKPTPELLALAERVRTMLAEYDPEDPAVAALKQSAAYQRVAYLIESDDAPGRQ